MAGAKETGQPSNEELFSFYNQFSSPESPLQGNAWLFKQYVDSLLKNEPGERAQQELARLYNLREHPTMLLKRVMGEDEGLGGRTNKLYRDYREKAVSPPSKHDLGYALKVGLVSAALLMGFYYLL